jgi:hypothetical protein
VTTFRYEAAAPSFSFPSYRPIPANVVRLGGL